MHYSVNDCKKLIVQRKICCQCGNGSFMESGNL
ncbi:MAG: hypothetical protein EGQ72_02910 [Anaeroglobus sp.]|nr:hypothetical protein [Anaeroglobus sp.]